VLIINRRNKIGNERSDLLRLWKEGSYAETFSRSEELLKSKPMDPFLLTLNGFSAYQIAIAQINDYDTKVYIDACIWSLRKALLISEGQGDGHLQYVLGKAYLYKDGGYAELVVKKDGGYADLAVKFLEEARNAACNAVDIPEYLGLAYARVNNFRESVAAFTLALNPQENHPYPSDLLLLSIARSYIELEEPKSAIAYLMRCVETSRDSRNILRAQFLLGSLFKDVGDLKGSASMYQTILAEGGENAEAHFQLGEVYAAEDNSLASIRARAEWRKAVRIDPNYRPALARLNML
jgi:tetratricopeptide (TPR) repeat protein